MTNQASEDTLNLRAWLKGNGWLWHESHVVTPDCLDEMQDAIQSIIRTEKLKLLDRLESKAFYDPSGTSPLINPREIQAERNKLEAEL